MFIKTNQLFWITAATYFCFCIFYFLPIFVPFKITIPLLILTITSISLIKRNEITFALFFSMIGDLMGALHSIELQLSAFAVAHVFFISYFYHVMNPKGKSTMDYLRGIILLFVYVIVCIIILPHVNDNFLRIGVLIYAFLILSMFFMACKKPNQLFSIGALFFVFSDFILGYHIFVGRIPCSNYIIMCSYYMAQLLIFVGAFVEKKKLTCDN